MTMVGSNVHCFVCTCCACGQELSTLVVECHKCHFRVHVSNTLNLATLFPSSKVLRTS